jgi:hypothetical protein
MCTSYLSISASMDLSSHSSSYFCLYVYLSVDPNNYNFNLNSTSKDKAGFLGLKRWFKAPSCDHSHMPYIHLNSESLVTRFDLSFDFKAEIARSIAEILNHENCLQVWNTASHTHAHAHVCVYIHTLYTHIHKDEMSNLGYFIKETSWLTYTNSLALLEY